MDCYVKVAKDQGEKIKELPVEDDGTLLVSTVKSQFPGTHGLMFLTESNTIRGIRLADGKFHPPNGMWGDTVYFCVLLKEKERKSDNADLLVSKSIRATPDLSKDFRSVIENCKGDFTLLAAEASSIITHLEDEFTTLQKENDIVWSIIIVREQLESIEDEMNLVFNMPDKTTMIQKLKDDGHWVVDCLKNFRITKGTSIHFVQWFYFLTYNNYLLCDQIRGILRSYNVETVTFSALVARIYSSTSCRIHHPNKSIGSAEIKDGLKMYGLTDTRLLECVDILNEIQNLHLSSQTHSIASSPSSSRSPSIASSPSSLRSSALMTGAHPPNVYPHSGPYHYPYHSSSSTGGSPYYHPYRSSSGTRGSPYYHPYRSSLRTGATAQLIQPRRPKLKGNRP